MTHPAADERQEGERGTDEQENPSGQQSASSGETIRLVAVFVLGISVGICLTLLYLEFS